MSVSFFCILDTLHTYIKQEINEIELIWVNIPSIYSLFASDSRIVLLKFIHELTLCKKERELLACSRPFFYLYVGICY